ncbi:exonuclease domain-containing protein [Pseudochelatococcus lubricantis]|uniref:3'-5' exonuclease n=1 Tax=Pseudochelatococcus lubricantis TaxID=1538102 RepID=UPI0035F05F82
MRGDRRLLLALLAPGVLLAAWEAVALLLLFTGAAPESRTGLGTALSTQAPVLAIWWLAAAAAAAFGLYRLHAIFVAGADRLADATRVLAGDPQAPAIPPQGNATLRALAEAINTLADRHRTLRSDMDERIADASEAVAYQRDQLAALMAELEQGVIVCNLDGRILLYNQQSSRLFASCGGTVGLGRSIDALLDPALIAHAREMLEQRGAGGAPAHFVTGLPDGHLLRVGMAGVRPAGEGATAALTGFVLLVDDITEEQRAHASRDARLLTLTEASRASLAAMQAALDLMDYPDLAEDERARFQAIVRDEVSAMGRRLEALAADTSEDLKGRWPLQDMLGADLLAAAARRIAATSGDAAETDAEPGLWLRVDSFAVISALAFLAGRHGAAAGRPALRLRRAEGRAHLDLLWRGESAEPAPGWQTEPMQVGDERLPLTVRDVAERHGGEVWFGRQREGSDRFVRFLLPLASGAPQAPLAPSDSRPVYYDFDLFRASAEGSTLDERPLTGISYTVFDTETTGLDPAGGDEIIQIGATRIVNGRLLAGECFDQLVNPGRHIPEASIPIHGIRPEMVRGKPPIAEVLPLFHAFAADTVLVGHNVAFDMRFLQIKEAVSGVRFEQPVLDTLLLASIVHPHETEHGLEATAARLGINLAARHTAVGDALTTAAIFLKLLPLLAQKGVTTLGEARAASARSFYARLRY